MSAAAMAQTGDPQKDKEKAAKDLRTDVRAHKAATHQVNHDLSHVRVRKAVQDHKAVAKTNRMTHTDSKRLKAHGVSHPVAKAKRQVRVQDDNHKDHI
jgi:hypothetical protein